MISETFFSSTYSSVWRGIAPTMDIFVRRANIELYEREFPPLEISVAPSRRALLNETAFCAFAAAISDRKQDRPVEPISHYVEAVSHEVARKLLQTGGGDASLPLSDDEKFDIHEQVKRIASFFRKYRDVNVNPRFKGCGIVDTCAGDVIADGKIFEIKAGSRQFRSIDFRQLLTYCALRYCETAGETFASLGVFNPRTGISLTIGLEELCNEVSGKSPADLLTDIVGAISSGEVSR